MTERFCSGGCTDECHRIWEERMAELNEQWAKDAKRARKRRLDAAHDLANADVHRGSLQHIGEMISPAIFETQIAPNSRSRLRVLEGGRV